MRFQLEENQLQERDQGLKQNELFSSQILMMQSQMTKHQVKNQLEKNQLEGSYQDLYPNGQVSDQMIMIKIQMMQYQVKINWKKINWRKGIKN